MTLLDDDFVLYKESISKIKEERGQKKEEEEKSMKVIEGEGNFVDIKEKITPRALTNCESGSLLMAMKVFN